ncbi:MAG TPA: plasmid maintenance protein CcdB [Desulfomicrobium sp.]|nr:plasmid maintenance protein CcdB [Desulfomicrobium sp.]
MAQFTVYANPNSSTRTTYPYLLDIQSDLLDDLRTTVVIPMSPIRLAGKAAISRLCPVLEINGEPYVALTQQLAAVDRKALGKKICDLGRYRSDIIAALDFIISGI